MRTCLECFAPVAYVAASCPKCGGGSFSIGVTFAVPIAAVEPVKAWADAPAWPAVEPVDHTAAEHQAIDGDDGGTVDPASVITFDGPAEAQPVAAPLLSNPQPEPQLSRRQQRRLGR